MVFRSRRRVSVEAMKHRYSAIYINTLVEGFRTLMETKDYSRKAIEKTKIEKVTFDTFGITIDFQIDPANVQNAYVIPPDLVRNHSLLDDFRRTFGTEGDATSFLKSNKKDEILGCVDPASGKVSGDFSKLTSKLVLFRGLLESGLYSPEVLASIYSHEVGHVWSYFFYIGKVYTTDLVLEAAVRAFTNTDDVRARSSIIEQASIAVKSKTGDIEPILTGKQDKEVIAAVILGDVLSQPESLMFSAIHDAKSWEQASDQFVSRLGLGKELGQGLSAMSHAGFDPATMGFAAWAITNTVLSITLGIYTPILVPLMLLVGDDPGKGYYDNAPKRLLRIKQDAITSLKSANLSKEDTKRALATFDELSVLISAMKEREIFIVSVWRFAVSPWRTQKEIEARQKQLEELSASNLYVHSARLKTAGMASIAPDTAMDDVNVSIESLDASLELLNIAHDMSKVGLEQHAAMEGKIGDILSAVMSAIKSLLDRILAFFSSDSVAAAAVDVEKLEEVAEKAKEKPFTITHDDLENSDSLTDELAVPLIATVYDPKLLPKTSVLIDRLGDIIKRTNDKFDLGSANNLDKQLEAIDKLNDDELSKELGRLSDPLEAIIKDTKLLLGVAEELNIEYSSPENGYYEENPRRVAELLVMIFDSIGKFHPELRHKVNRESVCNIDWSRSNKVASDTQAAIAAMRIKDNAIKSKRDSIAKLEKSSKELSGSDNSVIYLREYLAVERQVLLLAARGTKLMTTRLKGQRQVVSLVESISRDKR